MKKLIVALLLLSPLTMKAQNHLIGIKGAINGSKILSSYFGWDYSDLRPGVDAGFSYDYQMQKKGNLLTGELLFQQRGMLLNGYTTKADGTPDGGTFVNKLRYNYLALPLKYTKFFGNRLFGIGSVGIVPGILLESNSSAIVKDVTGQTTDSRSENNYKTQKKIIISAVIEGGMGLKIYEHYILFTTVGYQYGITNLIKKPGNGHRLNHASIVGSIGVKYAIH